MTCDRTRDDGAYVLGALAPAERIDYERHLAACPDCQRSVAEIAVLPGLLGRLDAETARAVAAEQPPPPRDRVAAAARAVAAERSRRRRRSRWQTAAAALAVAGVALVVGLGLGLSGGGLPNPGSGTAPPPPHMTAMKPVGQPGPVTAEIALTPGDGGTKVTMRCRYKETGHSMAYVFRMIAYGYDGDQEQVASWRAGSGDDLTISGVTRFGPGELARAVIIKFDGTPVLTYEPP